MEDPAKSCQRLSKEISALKIRIQELEQSEINRKQIEEALKYSENLQKTILSNVGAYIYLKDTRYRYTYVNNKVCNLFGLREDEIIGRGDDSFFSAASVEEIMKSDRRVVEHGEIITREETDLASSDNLPRTYWVVKLPLKDNSGNICGLCGISTDITDLKRAEESLKERDKMLQCFFDAVHESMVLIDDRGAVLLSNPVGAERLGKPVKELLGTCLYDSFPPDVALYRKEQYEKVVNTGKPVYFLDARLGRYFEQYCYPFFNEEGKVSGVIIFAHDITERKLSEEALKYSEERFRRLAENSRDIIFRMSIPDGKYEYVSPAVIEMTGYTPEEHYNDPAVFGKIIHPEWRDYFHQEWKNLTKGNVPPFYEYKIIHKSGAERWFNERVVLVPDSNGNPSAFEGIVTDVTERKHIEEQLKQLTADLRTVNIIV